MGHLDVDLAHRFLKGQLSQSAQAAWQAHIDGCEDCRELLVREKSWVSLLRLDDQPNVMPGGVERMLDRLEKFDAAAHRRRVVWRTLLFSGAAALCAITAYSILHRDANADRDARLAHSLGVSVAEQERLVSNLDALLAIQHDPWLIDEYDTVQVLASLSTQLEP